jgi:hypothetical protein
MTAIKVGAAHAARWSRHQYTDNGCTEGWALFCMILLRRNDCRKLMWNFAFMSATRSGPEQLNCE